MRSCAQRRLVPRLASLLAFAGCCLAVLLVPPVAHDLPFAAQCRASDSGSWSTPSPYSGTVFLNEIAWAGTAASPGHQWIELHNTSSNSITLTNWSIVAPDGMVNILLFGTVEAGGFYLMERTGGTTVADVREDQYFTDLLDDDGQILVLLDSGGGLVDRVDTVNGAWPGGFPWPAACSMERGDTLVAGGRDVWLSNNGVVRNGHDAAGNPVCGTPRARNSVTFPVLPGDVRFNEIAWSGTAADAGDQWIELVNTSAKPINVDGFVVKDGREETLFELRGSIAPGDFFLIETAETCVADVPADLIAGFSPLSPDGDNLRLVTDTLTIDTANASGGPWPAGQTGEGKRSMERVAPTTTDDDGNWADNDAFHRNGIDADGGPINGTPRAANSTTMPPLVLVSEVLYAATTAGTAGDEFVELCNAQPGSVSLSGLKVGDEERSGGSEGMYLLPADWILDPGRCAVVARNAAQFADRFGFLPDGEMVVEGGDCVDTPEVPNLERYKTWGHGAWALADDGDEVLVLSAQDEVIDGIAYASGDQDAAHVTSSIRGASGRSLQRVWPIDTDDMAADFLVGTANPGRVTPLPSAPAEPPAPASLALGMSAYWGMLVSHSSFSSGTAPPVFVFAEGRNLGMHFWAITDEAESVSENEWQTMKMAASLATVDGRFVALSGLESGQAKLADVWVWNPTDPYVADAEGTSFAGLLDWLPTQANAVAGIGRPESEGDFAIPTPTATGSEQVCVWQTLDTSLGLGTYDPRESWWMRLLGGGWLVAPMGGGFNEDDVLFEDTAVSGVVASSLTADAILDAIRLRRLFVSQRPTVAVALRQNATWMGSQAEHGVGKTLTVSLVDTDWDGTATTITLFDRSAPITATVLASPSAEWSVVTDFAPGSRYWARAVRSDGKVALTSPIWVSGSAEPAPVSINEVLPSPKTVDWDGNGVSDAHDEWFELYNAGDVAVGVAGWLVKEEGKQSFLLPMGSVLSPHGFSAHFQLASGLRLNNDGDTVSFVAPDNQVADVFAYGTNPGADVAWCRLPDGNGEGVNRCAPTPGYANSPAPTAAPRKVAIAEARRMAPASWVQIRGQVTVVPGTFSQRVAYVQDSSGGIRVYLPKGHGLSLSEGERIEISGKVRDYHGEAQISVAGKGDVRGLGKSEMMVPLGIPTGSMSEPFEGLLVRLDGVVVATVGSICWIDDGGGWARVYRDPHALFDEPRPVIGQSVGVVGVVSQYMRSDSSSGGYRLLPRGSGDIVLAAGEEFLHPTTLPETGQ